MHSDRTARREHYLITICLVTRAHGFGQLGPVPAGGTQRDGNDLRRVLSRRKDPAQA